MIFLIKKIIAAQSINMPKRFRSSRHFSYAHYWKGYAHYYLKEYDLALTELDTAFNQGYTPAEIYKVRWYVNYQKGNYDAALSDAQQVLQTNPNEKIF